MISINVPVLLALLVPAQIEAFGVLSTPAGSRLTTSLSYSSSWSSESSRDAWSGESSRDAWSGESRETYDVEAARQAAEELYGNSPGFTGCTKEKIEVLLTSYALKNRELEISLLESLYHSDAAIDDLMHLWKMERGEGFARDLMTIPDPREAPFEEVEAYLCNMINQSPGWAEPVFRLANLYYFNGRTFEANRLARQAAEIKPWHIEAPHFLLHMSREANDMRQAAFWESVALPSLDPAHAMQRKHWVENAVNQARQQLEEAKWVTSDWLRNGESKAFQ